MSWQPGYRDDLARSHAIQANAANYGLSQSTPGYAHQQAQQHPSREAVDAMRGVQHQSPAMQQYSVPALAQPFQFNGQQQNWEQAPTQYQPVHHQNMQAPTGSPYTASNVQYMSPHHFTPQHSPQQYQQPLPQAMAAGPAIANDIQYTQQQQHIHGQQYHQSDHTAYYTPQSPYQQQALSVPRPSAEQAMSYEDAFAKEWQYSQLDGQSDSKLLQPEQQYHNLPSHNASQPQFTGQPQVMAHHQARAQGHHRQQQRPNVQPGATQQASHMPHIGQAQVIDLNARKHTQHAAHYQANRNAGTAQLSSEHRQNIQQSSRPPSVAHKHVDHLENAQKRRKSNDGTPIPAPPSQPNHKRLTMANNAASSSSPLSELRSSQVAPPVPQAPPVDLKEVMLALIDEYLDAAKLLRSGASQDGRQKYEGLIATALNCFDSTLLNFRNGPPREEAVLRMRFASLIIEETTNVEKAGEVLVTGIAVCDQARLTNSKYAMQHMLATITFMKNPKAARKSIDKLVTEVEALKLIPWIYAFRMLGVTQALQCGESASALRHTKVLLQLAEARSHTAVKIFVLCLETAVHLRRGSQESLELAQRTVAGIRSFQLSPEMQHIPQIKALASCIMMSCETVKFSAEPMLNTMKHMQGEHLSAGKAKSWSDDGSFLLPIGGKGPEGISDETHGILTAAASGDLSLKLTWVTKSDMLTLGYMLSSLASIPRYDPQHNPESISREGLKISDATLEGIGGHGLSASRALQMAQSIELNIHLISVSSLIHIAQYEAALSKIRQAEAVIERSGFQPSNSARTKLNLLTAICEQGVGQLVKAYTLYLPEIDHLDEMDHLPTELKDIRMLAALNSVHVLRCLSPDSVGRCVAILQDIEPYCLSHPNKGFAAAFYLVQATIVPPETPIITKKDILNKALAPAQYAKSKQLLSLVMNIMTEFFFTDIMGSQADQAANAGRTLAKQGGDFLWVAVGTGMLRNTLQLSGQLHEAAEANVRAMAAVEKVPKNVRMALKLGLPSV